MENEQYIKSEDCAGQCVHVVETKEVVKEELRLEDVQNEINAMESELKNFDLIMERRKVYVTTRLARYKEILKAF